MHTAQTLNEVVPLLQKADRAARDGLWAALLLSYEAAPAFDSAMEVHPSNGFPLGWLAVFRKSSSRPGDFKPGDYPEPRWNPLIAQSSYATGIGDYSQRDCQGRLLPGELYLSDGMSFSRRCVGLVSGTGRGSGSWLLRVDRSGRYRVLSFSPELFFEREGNVLRARPMKGTAPRGRWASEDEERRNRLENLPRIGPKIS